MTGCLIALAVTISACEYGHPLPNPGIFTVTEQAIHSGIHIMRINEKKVTLTQGGSFDAVNYELTTQTSLGQGADFDGIYKFYGFGHSRFDPLVDVVAHVKYKDQPYTIEQYVTPGGWFTPVPLNDDYTGGSLFGRNGCVLKHETKNYYIRDGNLLNRPSYGDGQDYWDGYILGGAPILVRHEQVEETWGTVNYYDIIEPLFTYAYTSQAYAEAGTWTKTDIAIHDIETIPYEILPYKVSSPVSTPITVFADFTPFADTPPAELPDYLALQYKINDIPSDSWITIKEINNPQWNTILSSELPVFGRNITIPDLNDATTIYLRVYSAVGFIETTVGVGVTLTISPNRRPTWGPTWRPTW